MQYLTNREPRLDDVLDDPIVQLVMKRDGLHPESVRAHVNDVGRRLRKTRVNALLTMSKRCVPLRMPADDLRRFA